MTGTKRTREGSGRVKLEAVASAANVSTATVSRVFNEPDKVSEAIRERVKEAARALNWIPNAAGRALASSRTHIMGAIIPTLDNEIFARQIGGMQAVFSNAGFTLFLGCSNYDPLEGLRQAEAMLARGVEAIALVGENHPAELFAALKARDIPYVVTYSYSKLSEHPCIGFDNRAAFTRITDHLLSLGHRRFAGIFQPVANNDRVAARLAGVRDALAAAGLQLSDDNLLIGPSTLEFGAESFSHLMTRQGEARPTAIVCGNDNIALGALMAANTLGLTAPRDFSITGFDDLAISSRFAPRLTTMKVDNQAIGTLAANQLLAVVAGRQAGPQSEEVVPVLQVRDSSGRWSEDRA
ncbi:LacI family DNA-binding transcriptional regulator [Bradyrhizobium sp. CIAT3101]|uniref:LacI family DNA-binding transcriptional regulator n=1 Tax=Bradyrhizobium sp. CIAT3101 TaxID=439387 RepID=UPI0024B247BC|nr:LacI family DNA-binding transcriptional regulator [Bradyrhizobium sp. CIAT3101]WFU84972.1 LacI family DNA-binding transcriptional regulator [Bradyrhizobium sp. CIAT3101]